MKLNIPNVISAVAFLGVCLMFAISDSTRDLLNHLVKEPTFFDGLIFVICLAAAVIFMPLTAMPLIPMGSMIFGPLVTSLLSIVGWTVGAVGAFLVSRYMARPLVSKVSDLEGLDKFINNYTGKTRFVLIVLLRLTIPVDIGSYALGLTSGVRLLEYTLATIIGVTWFSFAFAYLGTNLVESNLLWVISIVSLSAIVFIGSSVYILKIKKGSNDKSSKY